MSFYTYLFGLFDDFFAESEQHDGRTQMPINSLLILQEIRPIVKALLVRLASAVGRPVFLVKFARLGIDQQQNPV